MQKWQQTADGKFMAVMDGMIVLTDGNAQNPSVEMVIEHSAGDAAQAKALVKQQGMALTQEALGQLQGKASLDVRKNHDSYERIMKRAEAAREADRTDPIKAEDLADAEFSFSLREDAQTEAEQEGETRQFSLDRDVERKETNQFYDKPFDEQVRALIEGKMRGDGMLLVGRTPEILRQIGLGDLPMTLNQTHVNYIVNGTKDADHYMGEAWLKKLPEMLKKPVAVISSDTDAENSVVVILTEKINGKQIIAPVYVNGVSTNNSLRIDSNNIATAFGKGNALTKLLTDALNTESSAGNDIGVYYWNKTEAHNLYRSAGLQLPGSSVQDGLIHSIYDAGSPVNSKMFQFQTDSQQFRRWFKGSKVVNEDGTPKVMYHGTATEFWKFEKRKANDALGRRMGLGAGKDKFYLSEYEGVGKAAANSAVSLGKGKTPKVMELYVSAQKVMDRSEYDKRLVEAMKKYPGSDPRATGYDYKARDKAIAEVDRAIRKEGYDGVWVRDSGEMFVFDSTQIKSATDNVGTFDPENPDIRYSTRDLPDGITIRDYLGGMKPTSSMNETEKILLKRQGASPFRPFLSASPCQKPSPML